MLEVSPRGPQGFYRPDSEIKAVWKWGGVGFMATVTDLKGYFYVGISAFFWGTLGLIATTMKSKGFSSFDIAFMRLFFGLTLLFLMICFSDKRKFKIDRKTLLFCLMMGVINQGFFNIFYFSAIIRVGITTGVILLYTAPIFTMVFSRIITKEKLTIKKFLSIIMAFTGCLLTVTGGNFQDFQGNIIGIIYGILAGISYGILPVFNSRVVDKYHSDTIMFYSFFSGLLIILPFIQIPQMLTVFSENRETIFIGVGLGFFPTIISHLFFIRSLKYLEPVKASIAANFEVVVAALTAFLIYHEKLEGLKLLGILLVIGATIFPNLLLFSNLIGRVKKISL